ncbi:synaptic vesicle transporter [Ilyonectria destructans]|nr:synaptic vesicle transporter [Ilyonectria destructans]
MELSSNEDSVEEGLTVFSGGCQIVLPPERTRHSSLVDFEDEDDLLHPYNWGLSRKLFLTVPLALSTFTVALNSALFSAATRLFASEFGASHEIGTLGVSLYVLGFATGPLFWAPYSELKGRVTPIMLGMLGFSIFSLGVGAGKDIQTVLICRFWSGIFGASPMTIVAGVFADTFDGRSRGAATTIFSMNVLLGPTLAPSIGGFIAESSLGWRWTGWLASIMGFSCLILDLIFLEETYAPSILTKKAQRLRRETGDWTTHSKQEEVEVDMRQFFTKYLTRPIYLLFTEPLVFLISVYLAFIYGLVYLFLTAYPIVFQDIHSMTAGKGGLCYLGMVIGIIVGGIYLIFVTQPAYRQKLAANNNQAVPEWRLPPAMIGAASFAVGIFWFGWSGYRADVHWIVPAVSGLFTGLGLLTIFQQLLNYLIDTYLPVVASVNAGSAIIRSLCGAGFPLFAKAMFEPLGVNWASTVLGGVATLGIPIPIALYLFGATLRSKSKFST